MERPSARAFSVNTATVFLAKNVLGPVSLFLFDTTQRVPLIFHWQGHLKPSIVAEPVSLIDVAPTILDLVGIDATALGADGLALRPGSQEPPRRALYAETLFPLEVFEIGRAHV